MTSTDPLLLALLQDIQSRLQAFDEAMAGLPNDAHHIRADMALLKAEVTVMRAVVTDHSYELKAYGERFRDLERSY